MKAYIKHITFVFQLFMLMLLFYTPVLNAQSNWYNMRQKWEVSPKFGTGLIISDLGFISKERKDITWAQSLSISKQLNPWLGIGVQFVNTELTGSGPFWDLGEEDPINVHFYARNIEYYFHLDLELNSLFNGENPNRRFISRITAGGGMANFISDLYDSYTQAYLTGNGHKPYGSGINGRTLEAVIPLGIKFEYKIFKHISLEWENSFHFVNSDKLDNVVAGIDKDVWWFSGIGLRFDLGFDRRKKIPLENYSTNPDLLPLKYKDMVLDRNNTLRLKTGVKPRISYQMPRKVGTATEFPLEISIQNNGVAGLIDIEILLPGGFYAEPSDIRGMHSELNDKLLNLYTSLTSVDTTIKVTVPVKITNVPVGNHAFYLTSKFTDMAGESVRQTTTEYLEKDLFYNLDRPIAGDASTPGVEFRVQLTSSHESKIPLEKLKAIYPLKTSIREDFENGFFQYTTGSFKTQAEAEKYRQQLMNEYGLSDLYVVFFQNGSRISNLNELTKSKDLYLRDLPASLPVVSPEKPVKRIDEYRIEIRRSQFKPISLNEMTVKFKTQEHLVEEYSDGWYYYYLGSFRRNDVAKAYLKIIRDDYGFTDARIVSFSRGERMNE